MKIGLQRFILLLFAVMLSAIVAKADNDTPELKYNEEGGYYEITSEEDMINLSNYVLESKYHSCDGMTFKVIVPSLTLGTNFNTIGNGRPSSSDKRPFSGTFDGQGAVIRSTKTLFGYLSKGTIENVTLDISIEAEGGDYAGIVTNMSEGTVRGCIVNGYILGAEDAAGIACINQYGTISDCTNNAMINASYRAGGIVWYNDLSYISNCLNTGEIKGEKYTAGIVANNTGILIDCTNSGNVESDGDYCGGIVGMNSGENANVSNCINSGYINNSDECTGGIVGFNDKSSSIQGCVNLGMVGSHEKDDNLSWYYGGVAGQNLGILNECTNSGKVSVNGVDVGGISGYNYGEIHNCKNGGDVLGTSSCGGIAGWSRGHIYDSQVSKCTVTATNSYGAGAIIGRSSHGILSENYYERDVVVIVDCATTPKTYDGLIQRGIGASESKEDKNPEDLKEMTHQGVTYYNCAVLNAGSEEVLFNLTYIVDDVVYKTCKIPYDDIITPEPEPSKEGYTFSGWSELPEKMPDHDVTVVGMFTVNKYILSYLLDDKTYMSYEVEFGEPIIPTDNPERDGYTFSGWEGIPETMPAHDVTVVGSFIPTIKSIDLIIWTRNGEQVAYKLEKRPVLTFTETDIIIRGENIDVIYSIENMMRYTYSVQKTTGLKDIRTDKVMFRFMGESLYFPSLKANSTVSVYKLNGTQIFKKTVHEDGEYVFPLSALRTGVYLVDVNGLTYKITKK